MNQSHCIIMNDEGEQQSWLCYSFLMYLNFLQQKLVIKMWKLNQICENFFMFFRIFPNFSFFLCFHATYFVKMEKWAENLHCASLVNFAFWAENVWLSVKCSLLSRVMEKSTRTLMPSLGFLHTRYTPNALSLREKEMDHCW